MTKSITVNTELDRVMGQFNTVTKPIVCGQPHTPMQQTLHDMAVTFWYCGLPDNLVFILHTTSPHTRLSFREKLGEMGRRGFTLIQLEEYIKIHVKRAFVENVIEYS